MLEPPDLYTTSAHPQPTGRQGAPGRQGIVLLAILLNTFFCGLVSQQFYEYWLSCFKDRLRLRIFVVVQSITLVFQCTMAWHAAYYRYVSLLFVPPSTVVRPNGWDASISSACQLIIILHANVFLALRIYSLTKSLCQSGLVIVLSIIAFLLGIVTTVAVWRNSLLCGPNTTRKVLTIVWHAIEAVAQCFITFFLVQAFKNSRCGIRKSDSVVNTLVRGAIQTGSIATVWAIGGLVTSIFVPHNLIYRVFDATSGSVYTHAIFDTLISRVVLRERMKPTSTFELGWTVQGEPGESESSRSCSGTISESAIRMRTLVPKSDPGSSAASKKDAIETHSAGKTAALYQSHQEPHLS